MYKKRDTMKKSILFNPISLNLFFLHSYIPPRKSTCACWKTIKNSFHTRLKRTTWNSLSLSIDEHLDEMEKLFFIQILKRNKNTTKNQWKMCLRLVCDMEQNSRVLLKWVEFQFFLGQFVDMLSFECTQQKFQFNAYFSVIMRKLLRLTTWT
jgi:hypothetical protein